MKVAVFGSWYETSEDWTYLDTREAFVDACRQIGWTLAERGHTLIIESDKEDNADSHVVRGYLDATVPGKAGERRIELAWPRGTKRPFENLAKKRSGLFVYHQQIVGEDERQRLSNSHLMSLRHADAVLTIGGKQGVYLAGFAARVAGKRLVPVASFGGASTRLLSDLQSASGSDPDAFYKLNGPWSDDLLKHALCLLEGQGAAKTVVFISHAHEDDKLAGALVGLIKAAFKHSNVTIRCSSVPGHKLSGGVHTASQLRTEIEKAGLVLGLVTPRSVRSAYVLFELGAAWGLGSRTIPLVARGVKTSDIPGPARELHCLDLAVSEDCRQLLKELEASKLMGDLDGSPQSVAKRVNNLVDFAKTAKQE